MTYNNISYNQYKKYSYYLPQRIGPGALPNEAVKKCYKCNAPVAFKRRQDGSWQLLDYFTGQPHQHSIREEIH
jgi:hypothetical protein